MDDIIKKQINSDRQIWKFSLYGFLKNLKFFEPYLVLFLLSGNLNLLQIGLLYSIREVIVYIFEIPSGIIADYYGRKKELYLCFIFYIISFIFFFLTRTFSMAILAMIFFGLGEAFRSGTHKAMIYSYLEEKEWKQYKTYVYGRTRSFSLIGSAISSLLGILLILHIPRSNYIFLYSILPFILDLILIYTYPLSLDTVDKKKDAKLKDMIQFNISSIKNKVNLRRILLSSSIFEGIFKSIKDLIQPVLKMIILSSGVIIISKLSPDDNIKVVLGISYFIIFIFSSFVSKKVYILKHKFSLEYLMNTSFLLFAILLFILGLMIKMKLMIAIIILFVLITVLKDGRKPLFVDICDDHMETYQRATVLSIESQFKSMFSVILAPIIGFLSDVYGIEIVMFMLSIVLLCIYYFIKIEEKK